MISQEWKFVQRASLTAMVAASVLLSVGCAAAEPEVELPALWREIGPNHAEVSLLPDGTGYAENLLVPQVGECDPDGSERYSGEIAWHARDEGSYVLQYDGAEAILWADTAFMGALNWDKVVLGVCGEDTPRDALVSFGGGTLGKFATSHPGR